MTDKKYYKWVVPTILVAGLLVGLVFSFQPAQAVNTAPGSVEASSAEVGNAPTATGPVCTTTDITDAIAYWDLDEPSGSTLFDDSITTTHDGTCAGDTCPSSVPGTTLGGQFFIETDKDVITVASSTEFDLDATDDFSVGAWVKTNQDCSGNKVFVGRYHPTNGSWWIGCYPEAGDTGVGFAAFLMKDSEGELATAVGDTQINDGRWHYIVGVRDGAADENRIYVDGASPDPVTPGITTGTISTGTGLMIGAYIHPGYYFNGTLDEVAIFRTALTDTDMATCTFEPNVGDVAFDVDFNTMRVITEAELLDKSSGSAPLSITGVDSSSDKSITVEGDPPGGPYTSATYNPDEDSTYIGTDFFTFTVSDGTNTASGTAILIQNKPVITDPGDQTDDEGDVISLQIDAKDPNGDDLTYEATELPGGLSIDPDTGLISGTISYIASQNSPYDPVTITVTDTDSNSSFVEFMWTVGHVNVPPDVTDIEDQVSEEGEVISLQVEADDPNGDSLTYSNISPDLLPLNLTIDPNSGLISGTIAAGASTSSPYTVVIRVTDGITTPVDKTFTWSVFIEINEPPVITQPEDQVDAEGDVVSLQIEANDPDGDTLTYIKSVSNPLPPSLNIDSDGMITGTIADGASAASPYTVTIAVSDGVNPQVEVTFTWTVLVKSEVNKIYLPIITK